MRIIAEFKKGEAVRFVSHLDVQRVFHRAISRARLPIAYSNGFNPHPQTSFASALPVGQSGDAEWMEMRFTDRLSLDIVARDLNASLPEGFIITRLFEAPKDYPSLTAAMQSADYSARSQTHFKLTCSEFESKLAEFLNGPVIIKKRKKSKGRSIFEDTDIRPMIYSLALKDYTDGIALLSMSGQLNASGALNADSVFSALNACLKEDALWRVRRLRIELKPDLCGGHEA